MRAGVSKFMHIKQKPAPLTHRLEAQCAVTAPSQSGGRAAFTYYLKSSAGDYEPNSVFSAQVFLTFPSLLCCYFDVREHPVWPVKVGKAFSLKKDRERICL